MYEKNTIVGWANRIICDPFNISSEPNVTLKTDLEQPTETEEIDFEILRKNG